MGNPTLTCPMCDEEVDGEDRSPHPLFTPEGPTTPHRSCMLRAVLGGIGHLIAHDHWCMKHGDPDAGLSYHQSAQLVAAWVTIVGIDH